MADDMQVKREIVLEADAETLKRMRKQGARARLHGLLRRGRTGRR